MATFGAYGLKEVTRRLDDWGLTYKKRWGQNFLLDRNICEKIAQYGLRLIGEAKKHNAITIWEIGPGLGSFSDVLYAHNPEGKLILFEIDYGMIRMLTQYIEDEGLSSHIDIVSGDAETSIPLYVEKLASTYHNKADESVFPDLITGNLPYSSGVRLLLVASKVASYIKEICGVEFAYIPMSVMLQKEAAERLVASPNTKEYGVSTVLLQALYDIKIDFEVVPTSFYPIPHVSSVICNLVPKENIPCYLLEELQVFQKIVHISFLQRRKMLRNTLGAFLRTQHIDDYEELCMQHDIGMEKRAENITPQQFIDLSIDLLAKGKKLQ